MSDRKRCAVCAREDTRGFSRLDGVQRVRFENGVRIELPTPATWVCRPGFECEGIGPLHVVFARDPAGDVDEEAR